MLKLFEVEGFKNFNEKITLDFSDVRGYQFNEHCIKDGLLKNAIIYGKNSSGKTNFSLALYDIVQNFDDTDAYANRYDNYLNVSNKKGTAKFRYVFQFGNDIVDYRYEKSTYKTLVCEKLSINDILFVDKRYDSNDADDLSGLQEFAPSLNFDLFVSGSIIKYALTNTRGKEGHVLYKMRQYVIEITWFKAFDENAVRESSDKMHKIFSQYPGMLNAFQSLLDIAGINDTLQLKLDADGIERLYSAPKHYPDGWLPFFKIASSGTCSLYTFFVAYTAVVHRSISQSTLFLIDEYDAFYHFELSETIVKLLAGLPDTQVILTSHNTNLMTNILMRPDCLFILTPEKLTSFVNATIMELREGHNLEKLYMGGEFNVK